MSDFLAALGLVFVIEGLIFAAFPGHAKEAMMSVLETPDATLRGDRPRRGDRRAYPGLAGRAVS